MPKGFSETRPMGGGKTPRLEDLVEVFKLPTKKWVRVRLVGPLWAYLNIWFDIRTKEGRKVSIPKLCLDYDAETDEMTSEQCPYRASGKGRFSKFFVVNAIIRDLQEDEPRKKADPTKYERKRRSLCGQGEFFLKENKETKTWTPVRVLIVNVSLADQLRSLADLNRVTNKKTGSVSTRDINDPKYGIDISLYYDPDAAGPSRYRAQREERTPLTEEEEGLLLWQLDLLKAEDPKTAEREMKNLDPKIISEGDDEDEDEDDDDYVDDKKKKKGKKSKKSDNDDDDLSELDDVDEDGLDEDEDEAPRKKKKSAKIGSKPAKSSKTKKGGKVKSKKRRSRDDEFDGEDFD